MAREAIETPGVEVRFLPSYSLDFNPIEFAFSKLKVLPRAEAGPSGGGYRRPAPPL